MSALDPISMVVTSVGTEQQAVELSEELLSRRLATCINIVPCLRSIYRWKGKVCEDTEYLLLIKMPTALFDRVAETILEIHSYELPEIMSIPIEAAEETFHRWVLRMVEPLAENAEDDGSDDLPDYD
jgi:periplasmic divalent cation tolerance protein